VALVVFRGRLFFRRICPFLRHFAHVRATVPDAPSPDFLQEFLPPGPPEHQLSLRPVGRGEAGSNAVPSIDTVTGRVIATIPNERAGRRWRFETLFPPARDMA